MGLNDSFRSFYTLPGLANRSISQISQYITEISHSASLCDRNVCMCTHFCYKVVHCGIWDRCIVGFVQQVYWHAAYLNLIIWVESCGKSGLTLQIQTLVWCSIIMYTTTEENLSSKIIDIITNFTPECIPPLIIKFQIQFQIHGNYNEQSG